MLKWLETCYHLVCDENESLDVSVCAHGGNMAPSKQDDHRKDQTTKMRSKERSSSEN